MSTEDKRLFLLDAYALIFRGYYAFIKNPRVNSKGENTSAIMGFTNSLFDLIKSENPSHIAVVFDVGPATVRTDYFPEYKATREKTPEAIHWGVPYIQEILKALSIPILYAEGYEADDVIGTLAKKAEEKSFTTYMVTSDKDFAQLVSDNIKMYRPSAFGRGVEIWGVDEVKKKFEIENPLQVIDYLGMRGDSVDNIPGIPGVGDKTAKKFIKEYGSLENLLDHTHELKGKMKENVEANKAIGLMSKKLATIITDVPVEFDEKELVLEQPDVSKIREIFTNLEFRRMLDNFYKVFNLEKEAEAATPSLSSSGVQASLFDQPDTKSELPPESGFTDIHTLDHLYQLADSPMSRQLLIKKLLKQKEVAFDSETTSVNPLEAKLVGLSFCFEPGKGYYVPFPPDFEEAKAIAEEFKPFFESEEVLKIGHGLKYDYKVLSRYGIWPGGKSFDIMIAHYLLNPDMRHNMEVLSEVYLSHKPVPLEALIGKKGKGRKSMREIEVEDQKEYSVEDADIALRLKAVLAPELPKMHVEKLFEQIEMPLMEVLAEMEEEGIKLDTEVLNKQSERLSEILGRLEKKIFEDAGEEFNLNSPKQLGEILFDKLKLDSKAKKTKTGQYATGEEVLSKLADKHPIINDILRYRQLQKLKSTYLDSLPKEVNPKTGRIHTTFLQTVTATGRLASVNPNLQNIPIRTEEGRLIRKAFVAKNEDYKLMSADYSQIELRVIASLSGDPAMIEAFKKGEDIHRSTAAKVFHLEMDEVTRQQRDSAKAVNFGIIYGVSAFGLAENIGISRSEAKDLIDTYYATYPVLKKYMENQIAFAREQGYVETIMGRRRYLADINSRNGVVRGHAERNAINAPIQGSAADIIKVAMVRLQKELKKDFKARLLLQVHDELILDVPKTEVEAVREAVKEIMEKAVTLNVPLIVDVGVGDNWLEAH